MDKGQLIQQLKEILPVMNKVGEYLDEIEGLDERIRSLNVKLNRPKKATLRDMILGWGIGYFCAAIIMAILMKILPQVLLKVMMPFFAILVLAGMVGGVYFMIKFERKKGEKENAELQGQIDKCKKRREEAEQEWISLLSPHWEKVKSIVPEAYASPYFVRQAYDYLVNGRADSMKEAINLFEEEQHRLQMEQNMQNMRQQYQSEMQSMQNVVAQLEQRVAWAEHEARVAQAQNDRW